MTHGEAEFLKEPFGNTFSRYIYRKSNKSYEIKMAVWQI